MGKFVWTGGVGFGWVSFLLKEQAKGKNRYVAMIPLRTRGE
jgi:hypothetical protein